MSKKANLNSILLVTPPFTQLNTPYPATAYLKGFLNTKSIPSTQIDLGIEVILKLFSKQGLQQMFEFSRANIGKRTISSNAQRIFALQEQYIQSIDAVITFLQGDNSTLSRQICSGNFLPEASRFNQLDDMEWAFGTMGILDKAKHLATLYLEDISDYIVECVDANFGFSRYAERLGRSANSFDELYQTLQSQPTYIDNIALELITKIVEKEQPKLVCFSVPFPGNLYSAFRVAHYLKKHYPQIKTAMGGGFANTELRSLKDERVFEFFDYITLDDGELPIELLYQATQNKQHKEYKRTFVLENNQVTFVNNSTKSDYKQNVVGTPDYSGLPLDEYISVIEIANPMHSLWSDGRWNKLTMAHGCYWGKCTFCDVSLDYIKIYEPIHAKIIVDRVEELIAQTGETGFHFVDEAAPPALMREVALEILRRKLVITWWTNIRFEKSFTKDLCKLLKASGCIAVSGGLEVASDRLLALIQKGVTVAQVAQACHHFTESGIMVHAYLMYGFPTQTVQETIDSLEMVRQMFELNILQSGFWHQFAMTAHSPVGKNPDNFGVIPHHNSEIKFAHNDIYFKDKTGINHDKFAFGLKKSLFNYMHGIGLDYDLQEWFDFKIQKTKISYNYIEQCLHNEKALFNKPTAKIINLLPKPICKISKGKWELLFHVNYDTITMKLPAQEAQWLINMLEITCVYNNTKTLTLQQLKQDFEKAMSNFELFWHSKPMLKLKNNGLLVL